MPQSEPKTPTNFTVLLAKILSYSATSQMCCEVLANESYVTHDARNTLNRMATRLKMVQSDIGGMVSEPSLKTIKEEILTPEAHLQIDNMVNIMIAVPVGIRNEIEQYAISRYNLYVDNVVKQ